MKLIKYLAIIMVFSTFSAFGKTTKEVWKDFSGDKFCQKGECAEGIPSDALERALEFYENNKDKVHNDSYLGIIDYGLNSSVERFFILDLKTGEVEKLHVTHGRGSESNTDKSQGMAQSFGNDGSSNKTSLGFFTTDDETYYSSKLKTNGLRLTGHSSTNSNALDRGIVIHDAWYADMNDKNIKKQGYLGRSQGCPAVAKDKVKGVFKKLIGGALLYSYSSRQ